MAELKISKITNVENHRNIRKWRGTEFLCGYQRISLGLFSMNQLQAFKFMEHQCPQGMKGLNGIDKFSYLQ